MKNGDERKRLVDEIVHRDDWLDDELLVLMREARAALLPLYWGLEDRLLAAALDEDLALVVILSWHHGPVSALVASLETPDGPREEPGE